MEPHRSRAEARYRDAERALWRSLGAEPAEHRIHLATIRSTVRVQEVGQGDPIVFIHGASTSGTSWASLSARLPDVRCLIVDRPGTGLSDPWVRPIRDAASLKAVAREFLPDLLDALGLERVAVISTSFGGLFAFHGALAAPGRVSRIVEFGWSAGAPLPRMPLAMRLGAVPVLGALSTRLPVNERSVRAMFRAVGLREAIDAGLVSDEAIRAYAALLAHTDTLRNELRLARGLVSPLRGVDPGVNLTEAERAAITIPVRFIWGDRDVFGGIDVARPFVASFPDSSLRIVPGAGHSPWMDAPDLAADLVRQALAD